MSKSGFIVIALIVFGNADSIAQQIKISNPVLSVPDTNILFSGISNRLVVHGVPAEAKLQARDQRGNTIKIGEDMAFKFTPTKSGSTETITIFSGDKPLYEQEYKIVQFPDPAVCIGTASTDTMSRDEILQYPNLQLRSKNNLVNLNRYMQIRSFDVFQCHGDECNSVTYHLAPAHDTVVVQDPETLEYYMEVAICKEPSEATNFTNPFRAELQEAIKNAKPGDRFIFDNIQASSMDSEVRRLAPYTVWIKE